jgi:hypothetical protein
MPTTAETGGVMDQPKSLEINSDQRNSQEHRKRNETEQEQKNHEHKRSSQTARTLGEEKLEKDKMKMGEVDRLGAAPSLIRAITHSPFAPRYFGVNQLATGVFRSNSMYSSSDGHHALHEIASPRRELLDAATCGPFLLGTSA